MTDKQSFKSDLKAGMYDALACEKCGKPVAFKDFTSWGLPVARYVCANFVCEHGHETVIFLGKKEIK